MKRFILSTITLAFLTVPAFALAGGFQLSDGLRVRESIGFAVSNNTKKTTQPDGTTAVSDGRGLVFGIFSGSIGGWHTANDYRIIGLGGLSLYASSSIASDTNVQYAAEFVPLTLFGDTFQLGIGRNLTSKERIVTIGVTATNEEITKWFPSVLK